MWSATISSTNAVVAGADFISSVTQNQSTNVYSATFATPFSSTPTCAITINQPENAAALYDIEIEAVSATSMSWTIERNGFNPSTGSNFNIVCGIPQ